MEIAKKNAAEIRRKRVRRNRRLDIFLTIVIVVIPVLLCGSIAFNIHQYKIIRNMEKQISVISQQNIVPAPTKTEYTPVIQTLSAVVVLPEDDIVEEIPEKIFEDEDLSVELQQYAKTLCDENDFPLEIFMSMIYNESRYTEDIISSDGYDHGLCQIRKTNFDWITDETGISDFMHPKNNMDACMFILNNIKDNYSPKNIVEHLMMYNMGPTGARRNINNGITSTTYTEKILSYAETLK